MQSVNDQHLAHPYNVLGYPWTPSTPAGSPTRMLWNQEQAWEPCSVETMTIVPFLTMPLKRLACILV
jgi:hypothetical protein